jgi:hypothetical protein
MKYNPLPLEAELTALPEDDRTPRRNALVLELFRTPGFQIVTALLRDLERAAYQRLVEGGALDLTQRLLGRLQCIEEIRTSLVALLPSAERPNVSWGDEASEEWTGPIEPAGRQEF